MWNAGSRDRCVSRPGPDRRLPPQPVQDRGFQQPRVVVQPDRAELGDRTVADRRDLVGIEQYAGRHAIRRRGRAWRLPRPMGQRIDVDGVSGLDHGLAPVDGELFRQGLGNFGREARGVLDPSDDLGLANLRREPFVLARAQDMAALDAFSHGGPLRAAARRPGRHESAPVPPGLRGRRPAGC